MKFYFDTRIPSIEIFGEGAALVLFESPMQVGDWHESGIKNSIETIFGETPIHIYLLNSDVEQKAGKLTMLRNFCQSVFSVGLDSDGIRPVITSEKSRNGTHHGVKIPLVV